MAIGWVIDHPAHARLFAPLMREISETDDVIIACEREEVRNMLENCDGHLPRRKTVWVPRPVGKKRLRKAYIRHRLSKKALKNVDKVISIGAPIELRVAPKKSQRFYITDTEINHVAHRLAKPSDIIIPNHFDETLCKYLFQKKAKIHRITGLHGHAHLRPRIRPGSVSDPPNILLRKLVGDGVHDSDEILSIPEDWLKGLHITDASENQYEGNPWMLDEVISKSDGVITQSVTLASEAAILGVPTLLVSKAKRGFLQKLQDDGYPIFITENASESVYASWLAGLHLLDELDSIEWPDVKSEILEIIRLQQ